MIGEVCIFIAEIKFTRSAGISGTVGFFFSLPAALFFSSFAADNATYKSLCRSVGRLVGRFVGLSYFAFSAFLRYLKVDKCRFKSFRNVRQQFWSLLPLPNRPRQRLPYMRPCFFLFCFFLLPVDIFVTGNATYKSPCRSVRPFVRPSACPSVRPSFHPSICHTLLFFCLWAVWR